MQWPTIAMAPVSNPSTGSCNPLTEFGADGSHSPTSKPTVAQVERIHTNERVPGHSNYYEKDGLRTYGDDEDHDAEPPMTFRRIMSLVAMAFRTLLPPLLRGTSG